ANGNEAAVYFCAPYWPEFSKVDLLRGIRTYQSRERSWQRTRRERAVALVRAVAEVEVEDARTVAGRLREQLPGSAADEMEEALAAREQRAD
ncbi:MAG: UDP pyrophosphate synthase, partial [Halolamina sp.]